ncbi:MAG: N-acetyltransferase family protein [Pseudomonadota bacterium]
MADHVIRAAEAEDAGRLVRLLQETYAFYGEKPPVPEDLLIQRLQQYLGANPGFEALLAEQDGRDLGYAIYAPVFWTSDCQLSLFLKELYLIEDARRCGVGRDLMVELASIALERGWTRMIWTVDRHNHKARRFYDSLQGTQAIDKVVYLQSESVMRRLATSGGSRFSYSFRI